MLVVKTIADLRARLGLEADVALVPTMGNLHLGHLDLVRIARQQAKLVVVSVFVNPLQFGANEDFAEYPRTLERDCEMLERCGVDVVFAPSERDLYPQEQKVTVEPSPIANELCGAFRPGHFAGVATVVLKLFNIVQPRVAVFGKKDYQQLYVVRQMAAQLNIPVEIIGGETVRAPNGLALSSRNQYLSVAEKVTANFLYDSLIGMREAIVGGAVDLCKLEQQAQDALVANGWRVDYVAVRAQSDLAKPATDERNVVILAAAWLGKTRLIDNLEVSLPG